MKDRVKYFSPDDLSIFHYLQIAEEVLDGYEGGKKPKDINDYLEIYNIYKFVENRRFPSTWKQERIEFVNDLKGEMVAFLQSITPEQMPSIYTNIEFFYRDCFWEALNVFKISSCLNEESVRTALKDRSYELRDILLCKWLVDK